MISEEMLRKAAAEADQAIRDSLPAPADCKHEFSPSFQRRMRRTFRKAKHPIIYKLPKYAACFVLVVTLASGTWLTVDAEARAAFFAWVREQYEAFIEYRFIGEATQKNEMVEYGLTWLPEGFSFQKNKVLVTAHISLMLMILGSAFFFPICKEMIPQVCLWRQITQRYNQFKLET